MTFSKNHIIYNNYIKIYHLKILNSWRKVLLLSPMLKKGRLV